MPSLDPQSYFQALQASFGGNATVVDELTRLSDAYNRQLWHEFSTGMLGLIQTDANVRAASLDIHDNLLVPVRSNLSGDIYVKMLYLACSCGDEKLTTDGGSTTTMTSLLDSATASLMSIGNTQAVHAVTCLKAIALITHGPSLEARNLLAKTQDYMATIPVHELNAVLQALYFRASVLLCEQNVDYDAFYTTAFQFYNYGKAAGLPILDVELNTLAYKTAIAGLLAKRLYNYGELITTRDFTASLESQPETKWALDLVSLCNRGEMAAFHAFLRTEGRHCEAVADLNAAIQTGTLERKLRLMALLHHVFHTPAHEREFSFASIGERCSVTAEEVEPLLLKAMALHLIEGSIDEVARTVVITWVQPRVMSIDEIKSLAANIGKWRVAVKETAAQVEEAAQTIPK